jgi:hypothetical protein
MDTMQALVMHAVGEPVEAPAAVTGQVRIGAALAQTFELVADATLRIPEGQPTPQGAPPPPMASPSDGFPSPGVSLLTEAESPTENDGLRGVR